MRKYYFTIISSILSAIVAVFIYTQISPKTETRIIEREIHYGKQVSGNGEISNLMTDFVMASKIARPSVVHIKTKSLSSDNRIITGYNTSNGSGVIVSTDGYIVTNSHVIGEATSIEVILDDNRAFEASLVGRDAMSDLALLHIEATDLIPLVFGDSDKLEVGEWVLAIGNPFNLQSTITAGIVSAKARNINLMIDRGIESFIQTDAAVNPGNSGGALVDKHAKLVGINTAILSKQGNYEGYSFAIPANLVKKVIDDIMQYGAVQRAWMGINIRTVNSDIAKQNNLDKPRGVYIDLVNKKSAAFDAGLKTGDILLSVDKSEINSSSQLIEKIAQYHPGDKVEVRYLRNGKEDFVKLTLKNQINSTDFVAVRKDKILKELGFELRNLDQSEKSRLNTTGVKVISIYLQSTIGKTNMEVGYIIQSINGKEIKSVNDFIKALDSNPKNIKLVGIYENYPGVYPYTFDIY